MLFYSKILFIPILVCCSCSASTTPVEKYYSIFNTHNARQNLKYDYIPKFRNEITFDEKNKAFFYYKVTFIGKIPRQAEKVHSASGNTNQFKFDSKGRIISHMQKIDSNSEKICKYKYIDKEMIKEEVCEINGKNNSWVKLRYEFKQNMLSKIVSLNKNEENLGYVLLDHDLKLFKKFDSNNKLISSRDFSF